MILSTPLDALMTHFQRCAKRSAGAAVAKISQSCHNDHTALRNNIISKLKIYQ